MLLFTLLTIIFFVFLLEWVKGEWFILDKETSAEGTISQFKNPEMFHVSFINIILLQPSYLTEEEIVLAMRILLANSLVRRKEAITRFQASIRSNLQDSFQTCQTCQNPLNSERLGFQGTCIECLRYDIKFTEIAGRVNQCMCCRTPHAKYSKGQRHHHRDELFSDSFLLKTDGCSSYPRRWKF